MNKSEGNKDRNKLPGSAEAGTGMETVDNSHWWILLAMGCVIGVILLDETIVGVALPAITADLGISTIAAHWAVNIYLLVFACLAAVGGRMGDLLGLKKLFIGSLLLFGLSSLEAGFAQSGSQLIIARGFQGVGAAVIFPSSLAMLTIAFPPQQRGFAMGLYGAIGTLFMSAGPLLGGLFSEYFSWRWIFWINPFLVLAIAAVVIGKWQDPPLADGERRGTIDFPGLFSLITALGLLVLAIMQGPEWGWSNPLVIALLLIGCLALGLFIIIELRSPDPLIELDLFASSNFSMYNLVVFTAQFNKMAIFIFGALYLQEELAMSAFHAGLAMVVAVVSSPIIAAPVGKLTDRGKSRGLTFFGLLLAALGLLWMGWFADNDKLWLILSGLFIWGFAMPFVFIPSQHSVMGAVSLDKQGQAGGVYMSSQLMGGTIGMAVCSTLFILEKSVRSRMIP